VITENYLYHLHKIFYLFPDFTTRALGIKMASKNNETDYDDKYEQCHPRIVGIVNVDLCTMEDTRYFFIGNSSPMLSKVGLVFVLASTEVNVFFAMPSRLILPFLADSLIYGWVSKII